MKKTQALVLIAFCCLVLISFSCIIADQALAVNNGMCQYYSQTAIDENSSNQNLGCGFTGPRWSSDSVSHVGWCSGATRLESVMDEAVGRLNQLNGCNHEGMCEQYTRNALRASELNNRLQCGFAGPRYESTPSGHKSWCLGARVESVTKETRDRYADLNNCTRCDQYATEAIRYNELRKRRGCNLSGPRWSSEREGHFRWCMGARLSSAVQEQNERATEAVNCR